MTDIFYGLSVSYLALFLLIAYTCQWIARESRVYKTVAKVNTKLWRTGLIL